MAAFVGNYNMILRLLRGGGNPHARTFDGETPQNIAARLGNVQASKLLTYAQTGVHPSFMDVPDRRLVSDTKELVGLEMGLYLVSVKSAMRVLFLYHLSFIAM